MIFSIITAFYAVFELLSASDLNGVVMLMRKGEVVECSFLGAAPKCGRLGRLQL